MGFTKLADYPARLGDKQLIVGDWTGPNPYVAATGQPIGAANNQTGIAFVGLGSIDFIFGCVSNSGTYSVEGKPSGTGSRKTWNLIWIVVATGVPVADATNLSAETVKLGVIGR